MSTTNVKENEHGAAAEKNNSAKDIDPKIAAQKQKTSESDAENQNGGLKSDEVLTSTMTGQVVAKKSEEKTESEIIEESKPDYDSFLNQRNEEREIQGGEQVVASGLDKGRPINGDGLIDTSVPSNFEQRFAESKESK